MILLFAFTALAAQAAVAPAPGSVPAPVSSAPAAQAGKKGGDRVCRSAVATGSIMVSRTCHTRAEWQQIDLANQANVDAVRHRASTTGSDR